MANLGQLVVQLAADTAKFEGDLGRAAEVAEARMRNIKDSSAIALGALTVAATAAGAALVAMFEQGVERAKGLLELSQVVGVSVENLSRLNFAADQAGTSTEALDAGLKKLSTNLAAAAGGNQAAINKFQALGISFLDTKGNVKDADVALSEIAGKFSTYADGAAKTALAIELFGRSGAEMIPLLNEGSHGLKEFADRSDALGVTLDTKTAIAADRFKNRIGELHGVVTGLGNTLTSAALPVLDSLAKSFVDAATNADLFEKISTQIVTGLKLMVDVGYTVYKTFDDIGTAIGALAAIAVQVAQGHFAEAKSIWKEYQADAAASEQTSNEFLAHLWDGADDILEEQHVIAKKIAAPVVAAVDQIKQDTRSLDEVLQAVRDKIELSSNEFGLSLSKNINQYLLVDGPAAHDKWVHDFQTGFDDMTRFARQAAQSMQESLADYLFNPAETGLKGLLKNFIDVIRRMVAEAASAKLFDTLFGQTNSKTGDTTQGLFGSGGLSSILSSWLGSFAGTTGGTGRGGAFGGFKASGGGVLSGSAYVVGEKGPELFIPSGSGSITPNASLGGDTHVVYAPTINLTGSHTVTPDEMRAAVIQSQSQFYDHLRRTGVIGKRRQ